MRIILVEDDQQIGRAVRQALKDESYALDWVSDGETALSACQMQDYELMLLDLGLPDTDGFEVLSQLRREGKHLPIIIITARDSVDDRIRGLDYGADDYLMKPFAVNELLARIRAVIRRYQGVVRPVLSNGDISLDPASHEASRDQSNYRLSAREYSLLQTLLLQPGTILSRDQLEESIYGWNEEVESNAVEFIIYTLRKKLGKDAIKNVRGLGWMVAREQ